MAASTSAWSRRSPPARPARSCRAGRRHRPMGRTCSMKSDRFAAIVEAPALPDPATAWSPRLVRVDLNEQAYQWVRDRLLARQFGPGEKLGLQALADELGVSRSPVHHALTRLVGEGIVTATPGRGYRVPPPPPRPVAAAHAA